MDQTLINASLILQKNRFRWRKKSCYMFEMKINDDNINCSGENKVKMVFLMVKS
jgi:hypothetical protein